MWNTPLKIVKGHTRWQNLVLNFSKVCDSWNERPPVLFKEGYPTLSQMGSFVPLSCQLVSMDVFKIKMSRMSKILNLKMLYFDANPIRIGCLVAKLWAIYQYWKQYRTKESDFFLCQYLKNYLGHSTHFPWSCHIFGLLPFFFPFCFLL